jgi:hypothetical protein
VPSAELLLLLVQQLDWKTIELALFVQMALEAQMRTHSGLKTNLAQPLLETHYCFVVHNFDSRG